MPKSYSPTKKQQATMDAAYEARKQVLAARQVRDDATPAWLKALRQYIDAVAEHAYWEHQPGADGHTSSDSTGAEHCAVLWALVVATLPQEPRVTAADLHIPTNIAREAQEIGARDDERRQRLELADEIRPYQLSAEAMNVARRKKRGTKVPMPLQK